MTARPPWRFRLSILVVLAVVGMGCVQTQPTALDMTPEPFRVETKHDARVVLVVVGGTPGEGVVSAPNAALRESVLAAIQESGVFRLSERDQADFELQVVLARVNFPIAGFDFSVDVEMIWNLARTSEERTIWQALIATSASGGTEVAFNAQTRSALLTGKAIEDNIREGITRLSAADLE